MYVGDASGTVRSGLIVMLLPKTRLLRLLPLVGSADLQLRASLRASGRAFPVFRLGVTHEKKGRIMMGAATAARKAMAGASG